MFHQHLCLCLSGESGLGKSTLINSLFLTDLYSPEYPGPSHRIKKTVQVTFFTSLCHVFCHVALHIACLDMLYMVWLFHIHGCDVVTRLRQVKFKCSSSKFNSFVSFFCQSFCFRHHSRLSLLIYTMWLFISAAEVEMHYMEPFPELCVFYLNI